MKSEFRSRLSGDWLDDDCCFQLDEDLIYYSELLNYEIVVPKGFVTDFASVPRFVVLYSFFGNKAHHESVIHDWLYFTALTTREISDKIFLEAMEVRKKNLYVRYGMYSGVRIGGWVAWNAHREKGDPNVVKDKSEVGTK